MATLTILMENTVRTSGLSAEHGLSFWLKAGDRNILFDTGTSDGYLRNANALGINPADADTVILSHGHYDHGDGLASFPFGKAPAGLCIHVHPDMFLPRLHVPEDRRIGFSWTRESLPCPKETWQVGRGMRTLAPGIFLVSDTPYVTPFESPAEYFHIVREQKQEVDRFADEQILVVEEGDGLAVILGCSHPGVINALLHVRQQFGDRPIHTVVGGMHLHSVTAERLQATAQAFRDLAIRRIAPIHCTGMEAACYLKKELGEAVRFLGTGDRLEI